MIGELLAAVVAPEDLLGDQVLDAAVLQDLGQRRRVAKGVGQPQDLAVDAQLLPEIAHAVDQLAHQGFAGGHVGVRFHPHAALGDPAALLDGSLDPLEQLGIILLAIGVGLGLALQEFVTRVFFDQPQLSRKGAGDLPLGLLQGPQPGHVQMGVADAVESGGCAAVDAGKGLFQNLAALFVAGNAAL